MELNIKKMQKYNIQNVICILFILIIIFIFNAYICDVSAADFLNGFEQSTPDLYIGENDGLYLRPVGFYFTLLNNDFLCYNPGVTGACGSDKLMSNSMGTGFQFGTTIGKKFYHSFAASLNWRAITPAERPYNNAQPYAQPIGVFADWVELSTAYALTWKSILGGWKLKVGGNIGNVGDHGMKDIQRFIHEYTNQDYEYLTYDNQPNGPTYGYSGEFAYILPVIPLYKARLNGQIGIGKKNGKFMDENYLALNGVLAFSPNFKLGVERRFIQQISSQVYGDIIYPNRNEVAVSLLISPYYQITGRWVSAYLQGDYHGQFYLSFLEFNIPM